jgi:hypothetical protein
MTRITRHRHNPPTGAALALPSWTGRRLSIVARLTGATLALFIAGESFDGAQTFAVVIALLTLAGLLPAPSGLARRLPWVGAGVLFFGGALLAHLALGQLVIVAGVLAAAAAAIDDQQQRRTTGALAFFATFGLMALVVAATVLGFEG